MQLQRNQQNYRDVVLSTAGPQVNSVQTVTVLPSPSNLDSCIDICCLECTACCTMNERSEAHWFRLAIWTLRTLRVEAERGSCPCISTVHAWYACTVEMQGNSKTQRWTLNNKVFNMNEEKAHVKLLNCIKDIKLGKSKKIFILYSIKFKWENHCKKEHRG